MNESYKYIENSARFSVATIIYTWKTLSKKQSQKNTIRILPWCCRWICFYARISAEF